MYPDAEIAHFLTSACSMLISGEREGSSFQAPHLREEHPEGKARKWFGRVRCQWKVSIQSKFPSSFHHLQHRTASSSTDCQRLFFSWKLVLRSKLDLNFSNIISHTAVPDGLKLFSQVRAMSTSLPSLAWSCSFSRVRVPFLQKSNSSKDHFRRLGRENTLNRHLGTCEPHGPSQSCKGKNPRSFRQAKFIFYPTLP